ncbi:riboflavin synthase [Saccharobesus litoralis]|uniref:Riboflavin synthase n=1 Tax=Saccharobesus litoralis TaxID=2172099 RepID=A0A2S0VLY5_9ALTE|nr:riboflavin synthase subunit alpha [Saccharobesus litoralis]AWB65218.1 riboflavin synthase [Saccharobesus litoralis]
MFTGIVKFETQLVAVESKPYGKQFILELTDEQARGVETGASVAINGACLTIVEIEHKLESQSVSLAFDVIPETLRLTNLADLNAGDWVNIERAAKFGDEIGGHHLSGHVHTQAKVEQLLENDGEIAIEFSVPEVWQKYVFHKGYIGLNGCSLTIGKVAEGKFWVHLIPETLKITNFDKLSLGAKVNLEIDTQTQTTVDTVERVLAQRGLLESF